MTSLEQDVRFGWRMLWKSPLLSLIAIFSLALAIGANTAIFTVFNAVLLHGVAVSDPARVVELFTKDTGRTLEGATLVGVSHPNFEEYAKDTRVFSGAFEDEPTGAALTYQGQTDEVRVDMVTGNYFDVLGVKAALGNTFTLAETATDGQGALVVLSHAYFERRFGGDAAVLGHSIALNRHDFMIAGVAAAGFHGTQTLGGPDLWAPTSMHDVLLTGPFKAYYSERRPRVANAYARLQPGVSLAQAEAAVAVTARALEQQYPADNLGQSATLVPLLASTINPNERGQFVLAFAMMMAVVGLVLLIACANVANLLLARGMSRQREIAVRLAMGATRPRLIRQLLAESTLMALLGGACGLLLARWLRDLLWAHRPAGLSQSALDLTLDGRVLLFALGLSVATGILFGLAPALRATRLDLISQLKERNEPASSGSRPWSLRGALLMGEVAFSLIALIGAGLFLASLRNIQATDPGFDAAHLASMRFDLGAAGLDTGDPLAMDQFQRTILGRVRALPGIASATLAGGRPMAAGSFSRSFLPEGQVPVPGQSRLFVTVESVTPGGFFDTNGIPLLEGRDFRPTDLAANQKVMIVNQTMAREIWPGQDAVGKRVTFTGDSDYTQVVGVARDIKYFSLSEDPTRFVYLPLPQYPEVGLALTVRTQGPPAGVLEELRPALRALAPGMPVTGEAVATVQIAQSQWAAQMAAFLLAALALLATILAGIGIYGVMSYGVRQRARELGIRMAMGASAGNIFALVLRGGMLLVGLGLAAGVAGAVLLGRVISTFLFGIQPADPATFVEYSLLFVGIALLASFFPAWRATRVDPMVTLRE